MVKVINWTRRRRGQQYPQAPVPATEQQQQQTEDDTEPKEEGPISIPGVGAAPATEAEAQELAKPRKRALLVGIGYQSEDESGERKTELKFAHKDVEAMRKLLLSTYLERTYFHLRAHS